MCLCKGEEVRVAATWKYMKRTPARWMIMPMEKLDMAVLSSSPSPSSPKPSEVATMTVVPT